MSKYLNKHVHSIAVLVTVDILYV